MPNTIPRPTDHAVRVEDPVAGPVAGPVTSPVAGPVAEPVADIVEIWGHDSFPASDPPTNW